MNSKPTTKPSPTSASTIRKDYGWPLYPADGTARVWDVAEKSEAEKESYHFVPGQMSRACFSPDGHELATIQWDGVVHLWNWDKSPRAKGQDDTTTVFQTLGIPQMSATFSPDGDQIAMVGFDKKIRLYSVRFDERGVKLDLLPEQDSLHDGPLSCVAFDPSRTGRLATASYDRTGRLWFARWRTPGQRCMLEGTRGTDLRDYLQSTRRGRRHRFG